MFQYSLKNMIMMNFELEKRIEQFNIYIYISLLPSPPPLEFHLCALPPPSSFGILPVGFKTKKKF